MTTAIGSPSSVVVAAGIWTDIISITAPVEAAYGDLVDVEVRVRNTYDLRYFYLAVNGRYNGVDISFSPESIYASPGGTYTFTTSFTMPNKDVRIDIWSWYWWEGEWYDDDYGYVNVALTVVPEVYAGTISRMRLEHNGTYDSIPAYDIPQDERGLVHIWGRNDMGTAQRMGISWVVRGPDGRVVEEYSAWEAWPYTGAGSTHEFIGGRFNLDEVGTYTINIALSMNPDDPEIVDTYYGSLCTVTPVVVEWVKLATRTITIIPEVVEWVKLASTTITLTPVGWVKLASKDITITPIEVEWVKLASKTIVLTPVEIPPEYELVYHHEYPRGKTYAGKAEQCTVDITVPLPEQLFPDAWVVDKIADTFADKVKEEDAEMLDIKVYQDITPALVTNYRIVAIATASPVPWAVIIPLILVILLVVAFTFLIREVKTIDWGMPIAAAIPILAIVLGAAAVVGIIVLAKKRKRR